MIAYTLVLGFIGLLVFDYTWNLAKNIRKAQRTKLPYVVSPYNVSIIFMIFFGWLLPLLAEYCLPQWMGDILYDNVGTYRWMVRNRPVKRYGKLYMLVNPRGLFCNVADASVVSQIVNARQDFPKPVNLYRGSRTLVNWADSDANCILGILDMYGPNVVTVGTTFRNPGSSWADLSSARTKNGLTTVDTRLPRSMRRTAPWYGKSLFNKRRT